MTKMFTRNTLVACFIGLASFSASAQTMQASLRAGNTPRTVDIYLKASETFSQKDESMTFVLAVPENGSAAPTLGSSGVSTNGKGAVTGIAGLQPNFLENNLGSTSREVFVSKQTINDKTYFVYTFIFAGTATNNHNWTKNVEQKMFSIQFNGCTTDCNPGEILLVNLPNGGQKGTDYWYFQANTLGDITNYRTPFYKSEKSKRILNGESVNGSKLSYVGAEQKVEAANSAEAKLDAKAMVSVFPTVTSGQLTVKLPLGSEASTVSVFSTGGKEVLNNVSKSLNRSINLSGLAAGTYYVNVINNDKVVSTTKVVLQK